MFNESKTFVLYERKKERKEKERKKERKKERRESSSGQQPLGPRHVIGERWQDSSGICLSEQRREVRAELESKSHCPDRILAGKPHSLPADFVLLSLIFWCVCYARSGWLGAGASRSFGSQPERRLLWRWFYFTSITWLVIGQAGIRDLETFTNL